MTSQTPEERPNIEETNTREVEEWEERFDMLFDHIKPLDKHIPAHIDTRDYADIKKFIHQQLQSTHTSLVAAVEGLDTKYVPADMIWVGDEDYEVGEYKLFPAKDPSKAMYCLTCKRFLHEEGCTCGTVSVERVLTIINSIFKE